MTASPMVPDSDLLPGFALLAAMVTGPARDRDHASCWGNYTLIGIGPQYTAAGGCAMGAQRRFAWCLRTLFMASYVSSDRQYFADEVARNLPIALAAATNPFGIYDVMATYPRDPADADGYRGMATWQQFYLSIVVSAVARKNPEWLPFAQFLAKFIRTWHEYPFYFCMTTYFLMCFEPDTKTRMTDFRAMVNMSLRKPSRRSRRRPATMTTSAPTAAPTPWARSTSPRRTRPWRMPLPRARWTAGWKAWTWCGSGIWHSRPGPTTAAIRFSTSCRGRRSG